MPNSKRTWNKNIKTISIPLPRSSGSAWTTTALPSIEFGPLNGILNKPVLGLSAKS